MVVHRMTQQNPTALIPEMPPLRRFLQCGWEEKLETLRLMSSVGPGPVQLIYDGAI
jgi:hypothetical protein